MSKITVYRFELGSLAAPLRLDTKFTGRGGKVQLLSIRFNRWKGHKAFRFDLDLSIKVGKNAAFRKIDFMSRPLKRTLRRNDYELVYASRTPARLQFRREVLNQKEFQVVAERTVRHLLRFLGISQKLLSSTPMVYTTRREQVFDC